MHDASAEPAGAGRGRHWRLVGVPSPTLPERLSRAVGLRVFRVLGSRRVFVVAGSMDRLRDLLADPASLAPTRRAIVLVALWRAPWRGWSGGVGPLEHMLRHRVSLPRWGRGVATVSVHLATPAPFREVLDAALRALGPTRPLPAPASADITSQGLLPAYLPAQPSASVAADRLPERTEIRAHDLVLRAADATAGTAAAPADRADADPAGAAEDTPAPYAVAYAATRHGLRAPSGEQVVLVDARRVNPRGRRAGSYGPDAARVELDLDAAGRRFRWGGSASAARPLDGPGLDAATLAALRQIGVVTVPRIGEDAPVPTAALLVQVAMTGAVVSVPTLPPRVASLVDADLRAILTAPLVETDALAMEARSVRQRRAAMRGHAFAFALPRLATATFPDLRRPPSVTAILATRRPEMLTDVLRAIIGQTYPELEVVLCLHGIELPAEARALLSASGRPFEIVHVPATASFGEALGDATRRAHGTLVTKFDDDDTYSVEHVWDLGARPALLRRDPGRQDGRVRPPGDARHHRTAHVGHPRDGRRDGRGRHDADRKGRPGVRRRLASGAQVGRPRPDRPAPPRRRDDLSDPRARLHLPPPGHGPHLGPRRPVLPRRRLRPLARLAAPRPRRPRTGGRRAADPRAGVHRAIPLPVSREGNLLPPYEESDTR